MQGLTMKNPIWSVAIVAVMIIQGGAVTKDPASPNEPISVSQSTSSALGGLQDAQGKLDSALRKLASACKLAKSSAETLGRKQDAAEKAGTGSGSDPKIQEAVETAQKALDKAEANVIKMKAAVEKASVSLQKAVLVAEAALLHASAMANRRDQTAPNQKSEAKEDKLRLAQAQLRLALDAAVVVLGDLGASSDAGQSGGFPVVTISEANTKRSVGLSSTFDLVVSGANCTIRIIPNKNVRNIVISGVNSDFTIGSSSLISGLISIRASNCTLHLPISWENIRYEYNDSVQNIKIRYDNPEK